MSCMGKGVYLISSQLYIVSEFHLLSLYTELAMRVPTSSSLVISAELDIFAMLQIEPVKENTKVAGFGSWKWCNIDVEQVCREK